MIIISAAVLGTVSFLYAETSANQIRETAIDNIHTNSEVSVHDIAEMMRIRVLGIQSNIKIISDAPLVQQGRADLVPVLFSTALQQTLDISDSYFWIDADGKLVWASSFEDPAVYEQFIGADRSDREYYTVPKETLEPYITRVINSVDGVPRIYIAQPIINTDSASGGSVPVFRGVIVSSVNVLTLGQFVESQVSPKFQSSVGMLGKDGQILYSTDHSAIGQNVFGEQFQSALPEGLQSDFNAFLEESLEGEAGYRDLSYQGSSGTLAYEPIRIGSETWAIMYVVTPHTFAESVQNVIDSQRNLSTIVIIATSGIALGLSILVIRWNKALDRLVAKRTSQLEERTEQLNQSNESLLASNTKLEQAYDELLVHDKLQKEFINIAAHELRTPIQPILSVAEILNEDFDHQSKPEYATHKEELEMLLRNAKRLEKLSFDLLQVARLESSGILLASEQLDLCEKIRNVIKDTKQKPSSQLENEVRVSFSPTQDKILVEGDRNKLYEVISNLLGNALKFTISGSITITADRREISSEDGKPIHEAIVRVQDTGTGIEPSIMPRLFSKFVSSDQAGGTGLGLYISKKIIEAHGGKIWAENNENGKGATFGFSLPIRGEIVNGIVHSQASEDKSILVTKARESTSVSSE